MAEPVQPREGDVAFAVSVATLYDLTIGRVAWDVRLTRWSSPDKATLTLANRTPGGPVLNILPWDFYLTPPGHPLPPPILSISNDGISSMRVGGYIDLLEQASAPAAPAAGSDTLRMYYQGDRLWFKLDGVDDPFEIPIGEAPGPSARYAFWMGGG